MVDIDGKNLNSLGFLAVSINWIRLNFYHSILSGFLAKNFHAYWHHNADLILWNREA